MIAAALVTTLPYAAILIALGTFIASQREFGRRAKVDYVAGLEKRIKECEDDRKVLHDKCDELEGENLRLMRIVVAMKNGGHQ